MRVCVQAGEDATQAKKAKTAETLPFILRARRRKTSPNSCAQHSQQGHDDVNAKEIQACWDSRISATPGVCHLAMTPQKDDDENYSPASAPFDRCHLEHLFLTSNRPCPQLILSLSNGGEIWSSLLKRERLYVHDRNVFKHHPSLEPKMRAILLDWLTEVCEEYKMHRETFYLAQDFIDRYMSTQNDIGKSRLQLIGITALFIAAKAEEMYPPKLVEFSYITDGACNEDEILLMELHLLKALQWSLCPITLNCWLNLYLQVATITDDQQLLKPQFSQESFVQKAQLPHPPLDLGMNERAIDDIETAPLYSEGNASWCVEIIEELLLDLCILDVGCLEFPYSVLVAAVLYHFSCHDLVQKVSGLRWDELQECVRWTLPFAMAMRESPRATLKSFKKVPEEDQHNIQTHSVSILLLERAQALQLELTRSSQESPTPCGLLTPPNSSSKK